MKDLPLGKLLLVLVCLQVVLAGTYWLYDSVEGKNTSTVLNMLLFLIELLVILLSSIILKYRVYKAKKSR